MASDEHYVTLTPKGRALLARLRETEENTMPTTSTRPDPAHDNAHDLMPDWLRAELPPLYAGEHNPDPLIVCKYFTPDAQWTWYATEFDGEDTLFGLVDGFDIELGYFSLSELQEVRGHLGLPIERDLSFTPQPLSAVQRKR